MQQDGQKINNLQTRDSVSAIGDIVLTLNDTPQSGRLFMDGSTHNKYSYPLMWQHVVDHPAYGTTTTNNFTLTDMSSRVPVGKADTGTFSELGDTTGEETHTLDVTEIPDHRHAIYTKNDDFNGTSAKSGNGPAFWYAGDGATTLNRHANIVRQMSNTSGADVSGGQPHNNIQPSIVVQFEVKAS